MLGAIAYNIYCRINFESNPGLYKELGKWLLALVIGFIFFFPNISANYELKKDIQQLGTENFTREILFVGTLQDCAKFEIAIIKALRKMPDTCYNRNYGGIIFNDAITLAKIGKKVQQALTGRKRPVAVGKAISIAKSGVALTDAHKQALRLAQTGKKRTPEICAKLSVALKGCNTRPKTTDEKEKIKAAIKKLWEDPAYRQRVLSSRAAKKAEVLA